jgi:hypothetical protein
MGNICIDNNYIRNCFIDIKNHFQQEEEPVKCVKCNDRYILHYGGKSKRTSCRVHNWVKKDYEIIDGQVYTVELCLTCNVLKSNHGSSNCYHYCYYE